MAWVMVTLEVPLLGTSIQWRGNFHWALSVSVSIPRRHSKQRPDSSLQAGSQISVFSNSNISANHLVAAVALLDWHLTHGLGVLSSEPPKSQSNGTKLLPLGAENTTGSPSNRCGESVQRYLTFGEIQRLFN